MNLLSIISVLLSVAALILKFLISRNDADVAIAKSALEQVTATNERITKALQARRDVAVGNATGGLRDDDGYRRD